MDRESGEEALNGTAGFHEPLWPGPARLRPGGRLVQGSPFFFQGYLFCFGGELALFFCGF